MFNQSSGITIGAYHAAPLVNLTLAYREWIHVDANEKDTTWAKKATEANRLMHVARYMDDRYSCARSKDLLPTFDMEVSSREEGQIVDFIGFKIDTTKAITTTYRDKQEKLPGVDITRYPF